MSDTVPALVIGCMDWRLHGALHEWAAGEFGRFDLVHLAGGASGLVREAAAEVLVEQIDLSQQLHGIRKLALVVHIDCGAHGGSASFPNPEAEREKLTSDLAAAVEKVRERFADLTALAYIQHLDGRVESLPGVSRSSVEGR